MILPGTAQQQHRQTHTVSVTVKIDGREVTSNPGGFISLYTHRELNKIPTARIIFADGAVEQQTFQKSNSPDFAPGKTVEILLGYNQQEESIFTGIITRHSVKVLSNRPYHLEIECKDPCIKTTLIHNSRYYYTKKDSDIFRELVDLYEGIQLGEVEETEVQHPELVQYHCTDWDFMALRADANGLYILAKDGTLNFQKPEIKSQPDLQVQFGIGGSGIPLIEFESEIDVRNHYPGVKGSSWDYTQQQLMEETEGGAAAGGIGVGAGVSLGGGAERNFPNVLYGDHPVHLYHGGNLDSQELNAWVGAKQKRGELSRIRGRVSVRGVEVEPGDTIEINGIGERFNGTHLVTAVIHQLVRGSWQTDIQFGWSKEFFAETIESQQTAASGLVAGVQGVQVGVVSKIEGDTQEGNHRIQVRLPYVAQNPNGTQADGIWARLSTLYAGSNRGFVFRPELNDEVIVGFINNDPNQAIILGSLHSNQNSAPDAIEVSDANVKKGFVAKEGMQILFDDQEKKIQIKAASGDNAPMIELMNSKISIVLDSSNSIELTSTGVTVKGTRIDLN